MPRLWLGMTTVLLFAAVLAVWNGVPAIAQESQAAPDPVPADPMQEVTPAREAAALTFAQLHHPELAKLLKKLKAQPENGYEDAIRDLFRTSERLARLKVRTPERYDLELLLWKIDSRVRLLAARTTMEDSDDLKQQLRELLREKLDVRAELLRQERDKQASRLEKLDADLAALLADPDAAAQQEAERLVKSAKAGAASQARNSRNAKANTPDPKKAGNTQTTSAEPGRSKSPAAPQ